MKKMKEISKSLGVLRTDNQYGNIRVTMKETNLNTCMPVR